MNGLNILLLLLGYILLMAGVRLVEAGGISLMRRQPTSDASERVFSWVSVSILPFITISIAAGITGLGSMVFAAALAAGVLQLLLVFGMIFMSKPGRVSGNSVRDLVILLVTVVILILFTNYTWSKEHPATTVGRGAGVFILILGIVFLVWTIPYFTGKSRTLRRSAAFDPIPSAVAAIVGIAIAGLGSVMFVNDTAEIAHCLGISTELLGFAVIGVGISLPEYIRAAKKAFSSDAPVQVRRTIATGNLGLLLMIGLTALTAPITVTFGSAVLLVLCMVSVLLFGGILYMGNEVGRVKAGIFLAAYAIAFMVFMQFALKY